MKNIILAVCLLLSTTCFAQKEKTVSDSARFTKYLSRAVSTFTFDGKKKPAGTGWDILEKHFSDNQFVGWGEYHNSPLLSQLAAYALERASTYGFKNWCVEVSPFVASELSRIARYKNPWDSLAAVSKDHPKYGTFPFFKTSDDALMLAAAGTHNFTIWGIDQEFQMAFPYAINRVYNAQSPRVRQAYKAVRDSLLARWWMPKVKLLCPEPLKVSQ